MRLLFGGAETVTWLFALDDKDQASEFHAKVVQPATTYNIPAIELDNADEQGRRGHRLREGEHRAASR